MNNYEAYIKIMLKHNVLNFGSFVTKAGRKSPFFFNTGNISTAFGLTSTTEYYAQVITEKFSTQFDNLYGPAYKGIPLAISTAEKISKQQNRDISFTFNRKEVKDHGEGGLLVGDSYKNKSRVIIIEDVLSAGTSLRQSIEFLLQQPNVEIVGAVVGIDRQEHGENQKSAKIEIEQKYGIQIHSIVSLDQIVDKLTNKTVLGKVWINDECRASIEEYRNNYSSP